MSPLRVGLVGAGHISTTHLRGWRQAQSCSVFSILDRDSSAAEARAQQFKVDRVCTTLDELIADSDIVDICTPPQSHYALAAEVVKAGKHLVIEKPIVTAVDDWLELRRLLTQSPSKICVLHNIKFSAAIQQTLRWVAAGRIGRVLRIERNFLTHPSHDRMLTGTDHWSHSLPGGRWFETLPHALYLTHSLVGALTLDHVTALATPRALAGAAADEVTIVLKNSECIATVHYSAHCRRNRRSLLIEGSEGAIEVDGLGDAAFLYRSGDARWRRPLTVPLATAAAVARQWLPNRLRYLLDRLRRRTPHARILRAFAAHLQGTGPSPTPLEEIDFVVHMSQRIGDAIDRAHA